MALIAPQRLQEEVVAENQHGQTDNRQHIGRNLVALDGEINGGAQQHKHRNQHQNQPLFQLCANRRLILRGKERRRLGRHLFISNHRKNSLLNIVCHLSLFYRKARVVASVSGGRIGNKP